LRKASVARKLVIRNIRRIQFAIQEEQVYAECGARLNNFYLSKLLCIFPSLFCKKVSTKHDITSTEISYRFLALKVPVLRRNKATNSSASTDPFSTATKTVALGNLSLKDLPLHSHGGILPLGIMKRIRLLSYFLHLYPQAANFPCECDVKSKNLE